MYPNREERNALCWQFQWYAWELTCFSRRKISIFSIDFYTRNSIRKLPSRNEHDLFVLLDIRNSSVKTEWKFRRRNRPVLLFANSSAVVSIDTRHARLIRHSTHTTKRSFRRYRIVFARENISCLGESRTTLHN